MSKFWQRFGLLNSLISYYAFPFRIQMLSRFYGEFVKPGNLCFDIGAHVGDRVRALRSLGAQVVAVEPQPHLFAFLQRLYGKQQDVVLVEAAMGRQSGKATMWISERTPTVSSLSQEWIRSVRSTRQFATTDWQTPVEVSVVTLDALIERFGKPHFIKIDVEGFEAEVLAGLSTPVDHLSIEYHPSTPEAALACIEHLRSLGHYRYNWTISELPRWQSQHWCDPDEMTTILHGLSPDARSGDLYAQLNHLTPKSGG